MSTPGSFRASSTVHESSISGPAPPRASVTGTSRDPLCGSPPSTTRWVTRWTVGSTTTSSSRPNAASEQRTELPRSSRIGQPYGRARRSTSCETGEPAGIIRSRVPLRPDGAARSAATCTTGRSTRPSRCSRRPVTSTTSRWLHHDLPKRIQELPVQVTVIPPEPNSWKPRLDDGQREQVGDAGEQQHARHPEDDVAQRPPVQPQRDAREEEHRGEEQRREDVELVGLGVELRGAGRLRESVLRHVKRARNRATARERPLGGPGLERRQELRPEPPAVDRGELPIAGLARVEPAVEHDEVIDAQLPGERRPGLRLDPHRRRAREALGLLAGPPRRLIAAPGRGERRQREQEDREELEQPLPALGGAGLPLTVAWRLRELVRRVDVDVWHRSPVRRRWPSRP